MSDETSTPTRSFGGAGELIDDGLFSSSVDENKTVYASLEEALGDKVEREPLSLIVPGRRGVAMVFNPEIDFELYQTWVDKATKAKPKKDGNPDHLRLALTVISHTNTGVLMNGKQTHTAAGDPLVITHGEMHAMLKVPIGGTGAAIRKLYGSDGHVIQTMQRILEAAGYSIDGDVDEADELDPLGL